MNVVWAPRAIRRVTEIAQHIAQDDPAAADKWVHAMFDLADAIPPFPKRAARVPEAERYNLRQVFHGNYRLIFRFDDDTIDVLTVRHFAQTFRSDDLGEQDSEK